MALRVVVRGDGLAEPAVLLLALGVAGLPDADAVEVAEVRLRVPDALDDRDFALVVERLDAAHRAVEALTRRAERQRGVRGARERRAQRAQVRVVHRDDGLQAVGAAG